MATEKLETLTMRDIIETLVTYNVRHVPFPHNYVQGAAKYNGLICDDKKTIFLNEEMAKEITRAVIIHEFLHDKHYRIGNLCDERRIESVVKKETIETYKQIYGVKP